MAHEDHKGTLFTSLTAEGFREVHEQLVDLFEGIRALGTISPLSCRAITTVLVDFLARLIHSHQGAPDLWIKRLTEEFENVAKAEAAHEALKESFQQLFDLAPTKRSTH